MEHHIYGSSLKPSQNKKGRKTFLLHQKFCWFFFQLPSVKKMTFLVQLEKFLALLISQLDRMIQEPIKANKNPSRPLSPSSVKGFQQDRTAQLFGTKDRRSFIVPRQRDNGTNSKSYLGTGRAGTVCQNPERDMERYQILTACLILFCVTKWDVL